MGPAAPGVTFQVGPAGSDTLTVSFANIEAADNGTGALSFANASAGGASSFSWGNAAGGTTVFDLSQAGAVSAIATAIDNISSMAATLGAVQNRLAYTATAISTTQENMSSSLSSIQDVNMASEMTTLTQQQVLQQAGTAMLSQANSQPQLVLKLITG